MTLEIMDISVVIGSYNQRERLKKVIDGYVQQVSTIQFEVVIVDSLSTDGTSEMIMEFSNLPFHLNFIQRNNPSGKGEARNVGVRESRSDLIIISDGDMIPEKNFVQAHYN